MSNPAFILLGNDIDIKQPPALWEEENITGNPAPSDLRRKLTSHSIGVRGCSVCVCVRVCVGLKRSKEEGEVEAPRQQSHPNSTLNRDGNIPPLS